MVGAVLVILALVALVPAFLIGGGVLMGITGQLFMDHAEHAHEGSELIDTNI